MDRAWRGVSRFEAPPSGTAPRKQASGQRHNRAGGSSGGGGPRRRAFGPSRTDGRPLERPGSPSSGR
eukprot:1673737-Alexandrium_andersonii.AAC.1